MNSTTGADPRASTLAPAWLPSRTLAGFVLAVLAVLVLAFFSYRSLVERNDSARRREQTAALIEQVQQVLSEMKDLETGERGFLLSGDEEFLQPYDAAAASLPGSLRRLRGQLADQPEEQQRLAAFEHAIVETGAALRAGIAMRREGLPDARAAKILLDRSKQSMDSARAAATHLLDSQHSRMREDDARWRGAAAMVFYVQLGGSAILLTLIFAAAYLASRDHRERELQLLESERSLRLNEMFMAVLGHDLRSPINVIGLGADLLARSNSDAMSREIGKRIQNSAIHMGAMIEDLLDVVRARQAGGLAVDRRVADLSALVQGVVEEQRFAHAGRDLQLSVSGALHGAWDVSRLQQLLTNLVVNALRHGDPGQPVLVSVDGQDDAQVAICVRNGGQIAPELLATLFDPFRRIGRDPDRSKGLGLGLYIAEQIARAHGGMIQAESSPGTGVEMRVLLPR